MTTEVFRKVHFPRNLSMKDIKKCSTYEYIRKVIYYITDDIRRSSKKTELLPNIPEENLHNQPFPKRTIVRNIVV